MFKDVRHGSLLVRPGTQGVFWKGLPIRLTRKQYRLVLMLATAQGGIVKYDELRLGVAKNPGKQSGTTEPASLSALSYLVSLVREIFGQVEPGFSEIQNVRGLGYRWWPVT